MIEHVWSVLCVRSILDRDTNNISLIDSLEQVNVPELPSTTGNTEIATIPFAFELVTLWSRGRDGQPSRGRGRIATIGVSGTRTDLPPYDIDLTAFPRVRNRSHFPGFQYQRPGRLEFIVELQNDGEETWTRVAMLPVAFEIALATPPN